MLNYRVDFSSLFVISRAVIHGPIGIVRGSRMGRGRQKAKHTKLARELKSYSPDVDYDALERELAQKAHSEADDYSKWIDPEADDEPHDEYSSHHRRA